VDGRGVEAAAAPSPSHRDEQIGAAGVRKDEDGVRCHARWEGLPKSRARGIEDERLSRHALCPSPSSQLLRRRLGRERQIVWA